jgi:hypothetical protein
MQNNQEYKITNIVSKYKDKLNKYEMFSLIYELKQNIEFNATLNFPKLFEDLSILYKDPKPGYNNTFTPDEIRCKENEELYEFSHTNNNVDEFIEYALNNKDITFYVILSHIDVLDKEIGLNFRYKLIPENIYLPKEYVLPKYYLPYIYSPSTESFYCLGEENIEVNTKKLLINKNCVSLPYDVVESDEDEFNTAAEYTVKKIFENVKRK